MKRLLMIPFAAASLSAFAAGEPSKPFDVTLEPGQVHEECLRLEAGHKRRYHWKSSAAVDFNIHYHKGDEVTYPVKRDGMRGDGGAFTAKGGEEYCWMWTARKSTARVSGQILD